MKATLLLIAFAFGQVDDHSNPEETESPLSTGVMNVLERIHALEDEIARLDCDDLV